MKYYQDVARASRRASLEVPPGEHGTSLGYYKFACLCPRCRSWARDYRRSLTRDHQLGRR